MYKTDRDFLITLPKAHICAALTHYFRQLGFILPHEVYVVSDIDGKNNDTVSFEGVVEKRLSS